MTYHELEQVELTNMSAISRKLLARFKFAN